MNAYFDTGILVKNYCPEPDSPAAVALLRAEDAPLPLTHFQEAEFRNAVRLKLFRREMPSAGARGALLNFTRDISEGFFVRPIYTLSTVFRRAESLSSDYTALTGARTLDILHVAAALEIEAKTFVSFDERQRAVAKKAGLKVRP